MFIKDRQVEENNKKSKESNKENKRELPIFLCQFNFHHQVYVKNVKKKKS